MALTSGTKLGPYEILSPAGAGGMGEVYRARDTRLGRDVAIKVLPEALANDADRLRRFEQEARTIAALNHANILGIHYIVRTRVRIFWSANFLKDKHCGRSSNQGRCRCGARANTRSASCRDSRRHTRRESCTGI